MAVCFLMQIKHDNDKWEKGVVVQEAETQIEADYKAKQGFHAYFGAYGYGHKAECDYVQCAVVNGSGVILMAEVDDRRPKEEAEA